ncbi:MAG: hypothetical protein ACREFH_17255, partial [Stellaceae bacterium]
ACGGMTRDKRSELSFGNVKPLGRPIAVVHSACDRYVTATPTQNFTFHLHLTGRKSKKINPVIELPII